MKNILKAFGIAVLAAAVGFSMIACPEPGPEKEKEKEKEETEELVLFEDGEWAADLVGEVTIDWAGDDADKPDTWLATFEKAVDITGCTELVAEFDIVATPSWGGDWCGAQVGYVDPEAEEGEEGDSKTYGYWAYPKGITKSNDNKTWTLDLTGIKDFNLVNELVYKSFPTQPALVKMYLSKKAVEGDTTAPELSAGSVTRTSDTAAAIGFTTDEAGTAYYLVVASGADAPAKEDVKDGTEIGAVTASAISGKAVVLTAGAKDIYVVVEDEAGNISDPLKISAIAYVDTTAPVLSLGSVSRTSDTAATISFTTGEAGTAYYLVLASGTAAPANTAVKAGTSLGAATVGANSNKAVTLTAGAKDIYVVVEDAAGNISAPLKIEAVAYDPNDTTAPVLSAGSVIRTSDIAATISFTTDEAGTAYYVEVASGAAAPANTAVKAANNSSLGAVTLGANSNKAVTLTAGARDIYVVVEDAMGNISSPLKIVAAAYVYVPVFPVELGQPDEVADNAKMTWNLVWGDFAEAKYFVVETKGKGDNEWGFGGLQFVLNGDGNSWGWDETNTGNWNNADGQKGDNTTAYIVVELDKLVGYNLFITGTEGQIVVAYYGNTSDPIVDLGFVNAYLTDKTLTPSGDDLEDDSSNVFGFITQDDLDL